MGCRDDSVRALVKADGIDLLMRQLSDTPFPVRVV